MACESEKEVDDYKFDENPAESVVESSVDDNVGSVIDKFLHRVLDIEDCAFEYISEAAKRYNDNAKKLQDKIDSHKSTLEEEKDEKGRVLAVKELRKTIREVERHNSSSPVTTLEKSLFVSLFSVFDKFIGDLIAVLYRKQPDLYKNINKEIPVSEALKYDSIKDLRQAFLDKEIESIRRKSYQEQFKDLENKFSIKLTSFDEWPYFIERAQRRNLFTHCDGVVSKQYLDVCREVKCKFKKEKSVGDQLEIGAEYLFQSCTIIVRVGVMLGQTLWRKVIESELEKADGHLSNIVFDYLHMEHWVNAINISKFAKNLPKISTEVMERIFIVNYAIALNAIGDKKEAKAILYQKDWSATTYDFKLAYSVLTYDYQDAKELMFKLGRKGELVDELTYHDWPLFREFRDSSEFFEGYEKVYGYKYSSKVHEIAETTKAEMELTEGDVGED